MEGHKWFVALPLRPLQLSISRSAISGISLQCKAEKGCFLALVGGQNWNEGGLKNAVQIELIFPSVFVLVEGLFPKNIIPQKVPCKNWSKTFLEFLACILHPNTFPEKANPFLCVSTKVSQLVHIHRNITV